jgi:hypothetical protein
MLLLLAFATLLNALSLYILDYRTRKSGVETREALPDLVHSLTPAWLEKYNWVDDAVMLALGGYVLAVAGVEDTLRFVLRYYPIILMVRAAAYQMTLFPSCAKTCRVPKWRKPVQGCFDYFFSGHTAMAFLLLLALNRKGGIGEGAAIGAGLAYGILVAALRNHYTIDVVTSLAATLAVVALTEGSVFPAAVS